MPAWVIAILLTLAFSGSADAARRAKQAKPLSAEAVNSASWSAKGPRQGLNPLTVKTQILLDRRGFSPGVIDGRSGENVTKAIRAFQQHHSLPVSGRLNEATWAELSREAPEKVLIDYTITKKDVSGPFTPDMPEKFEDKASLKRLGYRGPSELLAEKFHMDEDLLRALNPGKNVEEAGTQILVADVQASSALSSVGQGQQDAQTGRENKRSENKRTKVTRIEIDKKAQTLRAFDGDGRLLGFYPATIGSKENPAPSGTLEIVSTAQDPTYYYRPSLNFKGVSERSFKIAAGPNNPVGTVWIDLSKKGYGIHGTPEPDKVSKTASHGCIRLTNWDVEELSKMVEKGTVVDFID